MTRTPGSRPRGTRGTPLRIAALAAALGCTGEIGVTDSEPTQSAGPPATGAPRPPTGEPSPGAVAPPGAGVAPPVSATPSADDVPPAACATAVAAIPSRVWRLTDRQYRNSVRELWRRLGLPAATDPTAGVRPGLESVASAEQYSTRVAGLTVTEAAFGELLAAAGVVGSRLVTGMGDRACATGDLDGCARALVTTAGEVLFRRPLGADEVEHYVGAGKRQSAAGRAEVVRVALEAMLVAPQFLFRAELGDGTGRLGPFELAAALSFSLLDAPPDEVLHQLAKGDRLRDPATIAEQVARLWDLARARGVATPAVDFFAEYLRTADVDAVDKSAKTFPFHKPALLLDDAQRLVAHLLGTAGRAGFLDRLLTGDDLFVRAATAPSYGLPAPKGTEPVLQQQPLRAGLLTHPAWLVAHSQPERNDPIKRGRFVRERLLCQKIPPITVEDVPPLAKGVPLREALAQHRQDPRCAPCHALMDAAGLAFEGFDHLGRPAAGAPVVAGELTSVDEPELGGPFADLEQLLGRIARSRTAARCLADHSFQFFLGRERAGAADECAIDAAARAYRQAGGDYVAMLSALFSSPSFNRRVGVKP